MAQINQGLRVPTAKLQQRHAPKTAAAPQASAQGEKIVADPEALLAATADIIQELTAIMEDEMNFVRKADVAAIQSKLKRKNALIEAYQANVEAIKAHPEKFRACDPEKREALKAMSLKMEAATKRNATALEAAIIGTRSLVENIIKAIRAQVFPEAGYARLGRGAVFSGPSSEKLCPATRVKKSV